MWCEAAGVEHEWLLERVAGIQAGRVRLEKSYMNLAV